MITKFDALCQELQLTNEYPGKSGLDKLAHWCEEHVSRDIRYKGSSEEQYAQYRGLAQEYLDEFLSLVPEDIHQIVPAWEDLDVIQYAAYKGYDRYLSQMKGVDAKSVNTETQYGMTPLHLAALDGHVHTIETLISLGATPNKANKNNEFPLYTALELPMKYDASMKEHKTRAFQILRKQIPKLISSVDSSGDTVVKVMVINGYDELIKDVIKEDKALLFQSNNFGRYPIHAALLNGQRTIVNLLLTVPGMDKVIDAERRNALHYAALLGDDSLVERCCESNDHLDDRDTYDMTALIIAAKAGNLPAVKVLVNKGANVTLVDCLGLNMLHYAVKSHNKDLVSWILDHTKVNVNAEDKEGHTPLYYAQNNSELESLLEKNGGINPPEKKLVK